MTDRNRYGLTPDGDNPDQYALGRHRPPADSAPHLPGLAPGTEVPPMNPTLDPENTIVHTAHLKPGMRVGRFARSEPKVIFGVDPTADGTRTMVTFTDATSTVVGDVPWIAYPPEPRSDDEIAEELRAVVAKLGQLHEEIDAKGGGWIARGLMDQARDKIDIAAGLVAAPDVQ